MEPRRTLRLDEVADVLNCSKRTVMRILKDGRLPFLRIRGQRRVHPDDLSEYLSRSVAVWHTKNGQ